jgi:hypothetical protein
MENNLTDLDAWTRGPTARWIYSENPDHCEGDVPRALELLGWAKATLTTAVNDPDHSEQAIVNNGQLIMKGLKVISGWAHKKGLDEQHLACYWAMRRNHRGILRMLDEIEYFFTQERAEHGYIQLHETLVETADRGNFEAIAVVLSAMGTKVVDATIGTILLNMTVRLSSSFAAPTALGPNAKAPNWRDIEVLFLVFKKILGPQREFFAKARVGPTVDGMKAIKFKSNIDAMEALLFVAVQLCPQNIDAVRSLLQTTTYSARALYKAIELSVETVTDKYGGSGLRYTGMYKWSINRGNQIYGPYPGVPRQELRDKAKAIQENILQLLAMRLRRKEEKLQGRGNFPSL